MSPDQHFTISNIRADEELKEYFNRKEADIRPDWLQ